MKKGLSLLAVLAMLVFATGCTNPFNSNTDTEEGVTVNDEVVEATDNTEEVVNEMEGLVEDTMEDETTVEEATEDAELPVEENAEKVPEADGSNE